MSVIIGDDLPAAEAASRGMLLKGSRENLKLGAHQSGIMPKAVLAGMPEPGARNVARAAPAGQPKPAAGKAVVGVPSI